MPNSLAWSRRDAAGRKGATMGFRLPRGVPHCSRLGVGYTSSPIARNHDSAGLWTHPVDISLTPGASTGASVYLIIRCIVQRSVGTHEIGWVSL
jgi:hypothetical protein